MQIPHNYMSNFSAANCDHRTLTTTHTKASKRVCQ